VAPGARTDAYATVEKYGLIWVCLGDEPEAASPIFDMPEWGNDAFRFTSTAEIWEADYHTAKFTNLDYVHLPVVHGILFQGNENPIQAPRHHVTATEHGFQSVMRVNAAPSPGVWSELRAQGTEVESIMKFFVPGLTLRGQVEIGGVGSGQFNIFYEFTTPIDEHRTMMRHYFLRLRRRAHAPQPPERSPGQGPGRITAAKGGGHRTEPARHLHARRRQDHAHLLGPDGAHAQQGLAA
jgi:phenylpropionate dioxygenase-like ring-hydroxylating dioxygenase large terminal subunit